MRPSSDERRTIKAWLSSTERASVSAISLRHIICALCQCHTWEFVKKKVLRCCLKTCSDDDDVTSAGRVFRESQIKGSGSPGTSPSRGSRGSWGSFIECMINASWEEVSGGPDSHAALTYGPCGIRGRDVAMHLKSRQLGYSGNARPSTRPVLTGNGNRSPVNSGH